MATLAFVSGCFSSLASSPAAAVTAAGRAGSQTPGPAQSLPADFPLGSWTNYLTEADLEAAGYTDAAMIKENVGTQALTLSADGSWTIAVESSQPMRLARIPRDLRRHGPKHVQHVDDVSP
jgi:hypothetical protein